MSKLLDFLGYDEMTWNRHSPVVKIVVFIFFTIKKIIMLVYRLVIAIFKYCTDDIFNIIELLNTIFITLVIT